MVLMTSLSLIAMSPFAEEPPPITLSDGQTPSSIVIIGPSNWLLTLNSAPPAQLVVQPL
jgi:hypothetical protein